MIALTCVSLSSAADVNSTYESDSNINENLVVINNESVIENSTEDSEISNNVEEIDWSAYGINPDDYKNPTVYHVSNVADLKRVADEVWQAKSHGIDMILIIFDNNIYSIDPWFEYNLLHQHVKC